MKKYFLATTFAFSLLFVSCASKNAPIDEIIPDAPELSVDQTDEETDLNSEQNHLTENETQTDNEGEVSAVDENFSEEDSDTIIEEDSQLQVLEDINEPVVITLEYELPSESEIASEQDTYEEPEQIEVETPPAIPSDEDVEDVIEVTDSDEDTDEVSSVDENAIDITDENPEDSVSEELAEVEIEPSRKVVLKKQEYVDITYPGSGWIYMGLVDGSKDLSYFGRKLGTSNTKFTLQAKIPGTKLVHFYRNDPLTNEYLDDYIEIEILTEKGSNQTHIEAPAYQQPVPKKAKEMFKKENTEIEQEQTPEIPQPTVSTESSPVTPNTVRGNIEPPPVRRYEAIPIPTDSTENKEDSVTNKPDTNILLKEAKVLYNEKEYKAALDKINLFFEYATTKRDEGLYLKGQILEAKSSIQNIKAAMEAYTSLTKNYPASKYWDDANKRVIYLKRFYFGG